MIKKEIVDKILQFRKERDWEKFHTPKNLSESLVIEASELLEIFQWVENSDSKAYAREKLETIKEEVADVLIYMIYFCNDLGIDLDDVVYKKVKKNSKKYPKAKAYGNSKKYTEFK